MSRTMARPSSSRPLLPLLLLLAPASAFLRRGLADGDGSSWACAPAEDSAASCCGVVPAFFAAFNASSCSAHTPVVALALIFMALLAVSLGMDRLVNARLRHDA